MSDNATPNEPTHTSGEIVRREVPVTAQFEVYGHYWSDQEQAERYKAKIESAQWEIAGILGEDSEILQGAWEDAICYDEGLYWNSNPPRTTRIQRLVRLRDEIDRLIALHGDVIALRHRHLGMGHYREEVVLLKPSQFKQARE
jgi:hypothetical protein